MSTIFTVENAKSFRIVLLCPEFLLHFLLDIQIIIKLYTFVLKQCSLTNMKHVHIICFETPRLPFIFSLLQRRKKFRSLLLQAFITRIKKIYICQNGRVKKDVYRICKTYDLLWITESKQSKKMIHFNLFNTLIRSTKTVEKNK